LWASTGSGYSGRADAGGEPYANQAPGDRRPAPGRGRARPVTQRELLVLRAHLEASLLDDDPAFGRVIAEHRALVKRRRRRPGDRDRARELRGTPGWAWTRPFRRYDDYAEAVNASSSHEGEPVVAGRPSPV
jgi:hypothetical protein